MKTIFSDHKVLDNMSWNHKDDPIEEITTCERKSVIRSTAFILCYATYNISHNICLEFRRFLSNHLFIYIIQGLDSRSWWTSYRKIPSRSHEIRV